MLENVFDCHAMLVTSASLVWKCEQGFEILWEFLK
jgi:hypothetical protein